MKTLLDAVRAAGAGAGVKLESPSPFHGIELITSGTFSTLTVALEGSVSGNLWQELVSHSTTATEFTAGGAIFHVAEKIVERVRANITTYNSGTYATGSLLSDAAAPASGDTVTVGATVYKFQTASLASNGYVIIGGSAATALRHLGDAINLAGPSTPNVDYKAAAANASASMSTLSATKLDLIALTIGVTAVVLDESSAHLTKSGAALAGGINKGYVTVNYTPYPTL